MKILIVCRPRTRSTLLINSLSDFYNLNNKDENYKFCHGKLSHALIDDTRFSLFENCIKSTTQNNFYEDNFVIKLFPRFLILNTMEIDSLEEYNLKIIEDLSYYISFNKYNQVYFLNRDLVDSVCSWAYGNYINTFNFYDNITHKNIFDQNLKLHIDINHNSILKFYILETAILNCWKTFLNNNIQHISLDYNDIPTYISTNFQNIVSKSIDNKFNYKELIVNYNNLEKDIFRYYTQCYNKVKNIIFK